MLLQFMRTGIKWFQVASLDDLLILILAILLIARVATWLASNPRVFMAISSMLDCAVLGALAGALIGSVWSLYDWQFLLRDLQIFFGAWIGGVGGLLGLLVSHAGNAGSGTQSSKGDNEPTTESAGQ